MKTGSMYTRNYYEVLGSHTTSKPSNKPTGSMDARSSANGHEPEGSMGTRPSAPFNYNAPYRVLKTAVRLREARGKSVFFRFDKGNEKSLYNRNEKQRRRRRRGNYSKSNCLGN